ncbi:MAG: hypothetical protein Q4C22_03510, partial [Bacillota bacterium]|nr:hypothetical protein [Bacillota bacterium]
MNRMKLLGTGIFFAVLCLLCLYYTFRYDSSVATTVAVVLSAFLSALFLKNFVQETRSHRGMQEEQDVIDLDGDE